MFGDCVLHICNLMTAKHEELVFLLLDGSEIQNRTPKPGRSWNPKRESATLSTKPFLEFFSRRVSRVAACLSMARE
jgi:hypothetical protein